MSTVVTVMCVGAVLCLPSGAFAGKYVEGSGTEPIDKTNVRKGFERVIVGVDPAMVGVASGTDYELAGEAFIDASDYAGDSPEKRLLEIVNKTAAKSEDRFSSWEDFEEKVWWPKIIEAIVRPKATSKQGFVGTVKLAEKTSGVYEIRGDLKLKNEAAVKALLAKPLKPVPPDATPQQMQMTAETQPRDWGERGPAMALLSGYGIGAFFPMEAFTTGKLSLELGAYVGEDDKVGRVFGLRAPCFGGRRGGEDDLGRLHAGYGIPVKCKLERYTPKKGSKKGHDLFQITLINDGWTPPQTTRDRFGGLMAGWGSAPSSLVIGPSFAVNDYMKVFAGASFGGEKDRGLVFGVTLNFSDSAPRIMSSLLKTAGGKSSTPDETGSGGAANTAAVLDEATAKLDDASNRFLTAANAMERRQRGSGIPLTPVTAFSAKDAATPAIIGVVWQALEDGAVKPLRGVRIELMDDEGIVRAQTTSDESGRFVLKELVQGTEYRLRASLVGFEPVEPEDISGLPLIIKLKAAK